MLFTFYIILTFLTGNVYKTIMERKSYEVLFKFAEEGYLLKDDPVFTEEEKERLTSFAIMSDLFKFIPFINIIGALALTQETIKMYKSAKYSEKDKFYLSEEDRNSFLKSDSYLEKKLIIDKVGLELGLMYFASQFKTSIIINDILSLKCQLCPMAYTLDEVKLIAKKLKVPFTLGKIGDIPVALIGARIFRSIKTDDNSLYEISNDFGSNDHFKIYLIDKEELTDEAINGLVDMVKNNRRKSNKEPYKTNSTNLNNCLAEQLECAPLDEIRLEKRI